MTPLAALTETIVDQLAEALDIERHAQIDTRHDEKPHAHSGDFFIGIFPNSQVDGPSPDPEMGIDQLMSINIAVTQRTGYVPNDQMYREAALDVKRGCLAFAQRIVREMQIRRLRIPYLATQLVESPWAGQVVEPFKLSSSAISIQVKGPQHFHAEPPKDQKSVIHCQDFGLLAVLTYSGARYMENVISQTRAAMV